MSSQGFINSRLDGREIITENRCRLKWLSFDYSDGRNGVFKRSKNGFLMEMLDDKFYLTLISQGKRYVGWKQVNGYHPSKRAKESKAYNDFLVSVCSVYDNSSLVDETETRVSTRGVLEKRLEGVDFLVVERYPDDLIRTFIGDLERIYKNFERNLGLDT